MRKLFGLIVACLVVSFAGASFAQDAAAPAPATEVVAVAATEATTAEFTGAVEVTPADVENNETVATIVLDMGEKAYKLVIADAEKAAALEAANGKTIKVTGTVVAATESHLMDTIEVTEWAVVEEAPAVDVMPGTADAPDAE